MELVISMGLLLGAGIVGAWKIGGEFDHDQQSQQVEPVREDLNFPRVNR
ncbi:hypothetical protein ABFB09_04705 [Dehalogenimonas sp. THU2]